jgi:hypothetical protein
VIKIAFITSFRAKALARDWSYHVWLLERTVESMLHQKRGDCRVIVACHEKPQTSLIMDQRVEFLQVAFSPPTRDNDHMCVDKVLKLSVGVERALAVGCDYVVFNDADDLVSNQLAGYIMDCASAPGWYAGSEIFYCYGRRLIRYLEIPPPLAGPCVIVRADLLTFDTPPFSGTWVDLVLSGGESKYLSLLARQGHRINILAAVGLGHYQQWMREEGHPLARLPFPANIVINHPDSTSHVPGGIGSYDPGTAPHYSRPRLILSRIKQNFLMLPTLGVIRQSLRDEYSVAADSKIPPGYRGKASIFWR